jgi:hypothetical protein
MANANLPTPSLTAQRLRITVDLLTRCGFADYAAITQHSIITVARMPSCSMAFELACEMPC